MMSNQKIEWKLCLGKKRAEVKNAGGQIHILQHDHNQPQNFFTETHAMKCYSAV